ncbi:flagellar biosynthetic protein FliR [Zavarzinia sp. CC-PAN008]|uniref:flagellar biosynthetic protein FliR n=1 Tax=Zavarzinia sp. CC-PAN008 TaxID=3243332 RepID=UPI003F744927
MMTLADVQPMLFGFMLVFARIGAALMLMPAIGEATMPATVRLALGLLLSVAAYGVVGGRLPPEPAQAMALVPLVGGEVLTGLMIGGLARAMMAALSVAGNIIGMQSGLSFAMNYDPAMGQQSAIIGNFMTLVATASIFVTDLHHLLIAAMVGSYTTMPPGMLAATGDVAQVGVQIVAQAFLLGVQIGAPFLVYGMVFNVGLGMLNRLMPTLQVFFVALPMQVISTFLLFALVLPLAIAWYLSHFQDQMQRLVP